MYYYLGIDGGGTKTSCVLSDEDGTIIGKGWAGPSNYHLVGVERARSAIHACIRQAMVQSARQIAEIDSVTLGMAGVDRPEDHALVAGILDQLGIVFRSRTIDNDAAIALAGATAAHFGVVIISGTGSIAFGINLQGERCRAGGWGPILGDEGSGYDIGRRAMVAAARDADGRGPRTLLQGLILDELQLPAVEGLVSRVHQQNLERHQIASLATLVVAAAGEGDTVAREILLSAGEELATAAIAVIRRLNMQADAFEVGLAGGVFQDNRLLIETVSRMVHEAAPHARVIVPRFEPAVGALLLALRQGKRELTAKTVENIARTGRKG